MDIRLIRKFQDKLITPLFMHIDNCFKKGIWPDAYKVETGIPIPKVNNPQCMKEIRLISLTPYISKLMESIVLERTEKTRDKNKNRSQFGGRKGIGTTHVLADFTHNVLKATQKGGIAVAIFFDYSAAFNTGHRDDMVKSLKDAGVPYQELHMFGQLLSNRCIKAKVQSNISKPIFTHGGAAQGTQAGQEMYLNNNNAYDKKFPKHWPDYVKNWSYVDDTTVLLTIDPKMCIREDHDGEISHLYFSRVAEEVVKQMALFAKEKSFKLNLTKTKVMFFGNRLPENPKLHLKYNDIEIETVKNFKLLGVWLQK